MNEEKMIVKVEICGRRITKEGASLESAVNILSGYQQGFSKCLGLATGSMAPPSTHIPTPSITLRSAKEGSLDVTTFVDLAGMAGTLYGVAISPPKVVEYAINLYKNASTLIAKANELFNKKGAPVSIHVDASPGAVIIVAANDSSITTDRETLTAARHIHKDMHKIAREVIDRNADTVRIGGEGDQIPLLINNDNKNYFKVPSIDKTDEKPIDLLCGIYSLNKFSGKGRLQLLEEDEKRVLPFVVEGNIPIEQYIDGMKSISSTITAIREMSVNTLGETKVVRLRVFKIINHTS